MKILIDTNGNVGFESWFDRSDLNSLKKGLEEQGFRVEVEEVDYEFKPVPVLKKKDRFEAIPMTARNIYIMLTNADKENDDILKDMGIERESGFVITTLIRKLQGEYLKWEKIDNTKKWKDDKQRIMAFARYFEANVNRTNRQVQRAIEQMQDDGCMQFEDNKFPECKDKFNIECSTCQFGKKYIKTQEDADRFNDVAKDMEDE